MKIAILVPDNRENFRHYDLPEPYFGTAPTGLLQGFGMFLAEDTQSGLEIHVISCTQRHMPSPDKLGPNIRFHSLHVPKSGWLRSGYLGCALAVRRKLREIKPDIVHAQGTERDCAVSAVLSPYPRLLTIHGNLRLIKRQLGFRPFSAMWLQTFLEGMVVPRFDGIICITNYTRWAVEHEVSRTWVVPNAVDPEFLELGRDRLGPRSEFRDRRANSSDLGLASPPVILVVANIDARKNQNAFIRALDSLAAENEFEVRFFGKSGEDDYAKEFKCLVEDRSWCRYGGMIGREELREEFRRATILVLPTQEDNCPMVVLEAQAAGVPVAVSDVGGVPDLVENESSGLMINPNIAGSMSGAVSRLLGDASLCERLARCAYERSIERFHPLVIAKRHLEIYREVLSGKEEVA